VRLLQAQTTHSALQSRIERFAAVVHEAEDNVFDSFCAKIGVDNIREYEERQLKVAQEESHARLRFDTQIARLTHQFVFLISFHFDLINVLGCPSSYRLAFESEGLTTARERIQRLDQTVQSENANLTNLNAQKERLQRELEESETAIGGLKEELEVLQATLEERTKVVEQAKKVGAKSAKVLDLALKEISSCVRFSFSCLALGL
jgi:structural maintenance of chromosome 1